MPESGGFQRRRFEPVEVLIIIVIIGILAAVCVSGFKKTQVEARERIVKWNCNAVQLAIENFFFDNGREYPSSLDDRLPDGTRVIDLLPGGQLLENPFTRQRTEPVDHPARSAGQVGYVGLDREGDGFYEGYHITGFGKKGMIIKLSR